LSPAFAVTTLNIGLLHRFFAADNRPKKEREAAWLPFPDKSL
jgi:hypothetical protein